MLTVSEPKFFNRAQHMQFFNTADPVNAAKHDKVPPFQGFDLFELESLIAQEKYFVLYAPRQTGKTSSYAGTGRLSIPGAGLSANTDLALSELSSSGGCSLHHLCKLGFGSFHAQAFCLFFFREYLFIMGSKDRNASLTDS